MENQSYSDKLKDPRWQKKRLEVFNRDGFGCQKCGDLETTLHVHHKSYSSNTDPWDYEMQNFETLCESCHYIVECLSKLGICPLFINKIKSRTSINHMFFVGFIDMGEKTLAIMWQTDDGYAFAPFLYPYLMTPLMESIAELNRT